MALIQRGFQAYDGNHVPDFVKNGNFVLNKDSLQSQGLTHFFPVSPNNNWRSIWLTPQGTVSGTQSPFPTQFSSLAWEGGLRHIDTEFQPAAGTTQLGVIAWVQGLSNGSARSVTATVDSGTNSATNLVVNPGGTADRCNFFVRSDGAQTISPVLDDSSLFDGGPHLLAGFLDGTTARTYLDGSSNQGSATNGSFGGLSLGQSFFIGARNSAGTRANTLSSGELVWWVRFYENIGINYFESIVDAAYDADTRWDLSYETGRVLPFLAPAVAGANAPTGVFQGPLYGPLGGPIQ